MTTTRLDPFAPATVMLQALRERRISAVELLETHLERIERYNSRLNAIVTPDFERARVAASQVDAAGATAEDQPLLGLPLTIKDCFDVRGLPTTGGLVERAEAVATEDGALTARVRAAGAVIMGKTNVPPYASDWQSNNALFGRSNNPWDLERTPGGSTGGGAAALAAGLTPLEFGGDFYGSIRVPAAFCGVFGHKSSLSALPGTGHFPIGPLPNPTGRLAVLGPLARSAEDLELALDVVAGPDIGEGVGWRLALPSARHTRLQDFRVAIFPELSWLPLDREIAASLDHLAGQLRSQGVTVEETQPDALGDMRDYYALFLSIMGAIDAMREPKEKRQRVAAELERSDDEFLAAYGRGINADAAEYIAWHDQREQYRASFRAFFRRWDVLLAPVVMVNAFPHMEGSFGERRLEVNGEKIRYGLLSAYPGLANLSGYPATAFPAGISSSGLPIGLQAVGPYLEDRTPIRFAGLVARELGGFAPPPGYV